MTDDGNTVKFSRDLTGELEHDMLYYVRTLLKFSEAMDDNLGSKLRIVEGKILSTI